MLEQHLILSLMKTVFLSTLQLVKFWTDNRWKHGIWKKKIIFKVMEFLFESEGVSHLRSLRGIEWPFLYVWQGVSTRQYCISQSTTRLELCLPSIGWDSSEGNSVGWWTCKNAFRGMVWHVLKQQWSPAALLPRAGNGGNACSLTSYFCIHLWKKFAS